MSGKIYRLPPCPAYDVEAMESWLSDLAEEGLFLAEDGFFLGIAAFERRELRPAQYRLEAAQKSTSMWAPDGGEPDPDQVELSAKYNWEYVAKRGDFYIYRSFSPAARELNTDPEVQALAVNAVKKRRRGSLFTLLFWIAFYLLLCGYGGGLVLTALQLGSGVVLLLAALVLWNTWDSAAVVLSLRRFQKRLRAGEKLSCRKDWFLRTCLYQGKNGLQLVLTVCLICLLLRGWSASLLGEDSIPLEQFAGALPFSTMAGLTGEKTESYNPIALDDSANSLKEWSDRLAPRCIRYREHAEIGLSGGRQLSGGLLVEYYETAAPWLAERLVKELSFLDKKEEDFQPLETPEIRADFAAAYTGELHFPTLLLRKGNTVVRACFYQTSETYTLPAEEWMTWLADSIP